MADEEFLLFFIFKVEESDSSYGFINDKSGEVIFALMLPYLESMMDVTDMIIQRCKQILANPLHEDLQVKKAREPKEICQTLEIFQHTKYLFLFFLCL